VHEIEVTVYGWKVLLLIAAATQIPLAVTVGKSEAPETHGTRALVTQTRANRAGPARLHKVVFDRGLWDGTDRWWLDQQGLSCVVPAKTQMAVTADARAQAAAGDGLTHGRRLHTGRHGQGQAARTDRIETAVVGSTGLTTYDHYGTVEHGRHHNRRDCQPHLIHAVVIRTWHGRDSGPGGNTVFLTNASVEQPLRPFDDDDRSLIENCGSKEAKQPWNLGHPPQKTERAVRVHVMFTRLMFALATAYRRPYAREDRGGEPVGWQRWRRQLLEETRDQVIVCAQGDDGIVHLAEYALFVGVKLKDVPPGIGTRQDVLANYRLTKRG
jgi:hypothetical protein